MKKKIIIIEDEETILNMLEDGFKENNFDVFSAKDGEVGLNLIIKNPVDIILLDIILPKKDGFEILEYLKFNKIKTAPIFLLTNLSETNNIQKALDLGAKSYLLKADYQVEEIVEKVKQFIEDEIIKK